MRQEILEKRTLNSKTFRNPDSTFTLEAHAGHIHYKDRITNELKDIDTTLIDKGTHWEMRKAGYEVELPKKNNEAIRFFANGENLDFTHIKIDGKPVKLVDGIQTALHQITYPEVDTGIDLVLSCGRSSFRKDIVIKQKPVFIGDFFEIEFQQNSSFIGKEKGRKFQIGKIHIRPAKVWSNNRKSEDIELDFQAGGKMIKRIPRTFLDTAVYPITTDTTTSYYVGAGDGIIDKDATDTWANIWGASSGIAYSADAQTQYEYVRDFGTGRREIARSAFPIDTSAIPAGATISSATFNIYVISTGDGDNDGLDYISLLETFTASNTTLANADFNDIGYDTGNEVADRSAFIPQVKGATDLDITNLTTSAYNAFTLNATGLGWIKKSGQAAKCGSTAGWTCLGGREGHDVENTAIDASTQNNVVIDFSEQTGTGTDPYLSVTYTNVQNFTQTLTEAVILVDIISRTEWKIRQTLTDIITLVDTVTTKLGIKQTISDIITLVDSINVRQGFKQTILEIIILVDSGITLVYKMGVSILETITLIDTKEIRSYFRQTITSIISLVDTGVSLISKFYTTLTDAISLNDIIHIPGTWWSWLIKHTTSWTHQSKNTTTWTNQSKNTTSWTFQNKSDL